MTPRPVTASTLRSRDLTVQAAEGTVWHVIGGGRGATPDALCLDDGALLLELAPRAPGTSFQILTPHAVAAVRGTRWAMEVTAGRTSTLVLAGTVLVARPGARMGLPVMAGQGIDLANDSAPPVVKIWGEARIKALLARFGR
jgi:ferric-dicitrate binding protein FerR (iron transport regulator)